MRGYAILATLFFFAALASPANAQRTAGASSLSPYEKETLRQVAEKYAIDSAPEGKRVEAIDIVPLDVIEARDPLPMFLNALHATTRQEVLRREILIQVGEPYRQYRVDETVRALRSFQQLSLVLGVPIVGHEGNAVRLLLVTKDTWSLRTQFDLKLGAGGLDLLRIEPTERNLRGRLDSVVTRFELYPETVTLGSGLYFPRIGGRKLDLTIDANVVMGRSSGDVEGGFGMVSLATPQVTADQVWLYGTSAVWDNEVVRRYVGGRFASYDAAVTPDVVEYLPDAYRARKLTQSSSVMRSWGNAHKIDLDLGIELNVRNYEGPLLAAPIAVSDEFRRVRLPRSDTRVAPFAQARVYENRFLRVHDLDTLGLQEDYRVGYDAWLRAYPVTRGLGSSRDFLGADALAEYTLPFSDGFARIAGQAVVEVAAGFPTIELAGDAMLVSPRFLVGRVVLDAVIIARPHDYLNDQSSLGGEGRLRGFPSMALVGQNMVAYNAELRTRAIELASCQLGGAVFFDAGDAFDGSSPDLRSSVGVGLRGAFPQLDRQVFRLDVAFPLTRGYDAGGVGFYFAFAQAFGPTFALSPGTGPAHGVLNRLGGALGQ